MRWPSSCASWTTVRSAPRGARSASPEATLSRRLAELERSLGTALLRRTTRAQSLTAAGAFALRQSSPAAGRGGARRKRHPGRVGGAGWPRPRVGGRGVRASHPDADPRALPSRGPEGARRAVALRRPRAHRRRGVRPRRTHGGPRRERPGIAKAGSRRTKDRGEPGIRLGTRSSEDPCRPGPPRTAGQPAAPGYMEIRHRGRPARRSRSMAHVDGRYDEPRARSCCGCPSTTPRSSPLPHRIRTSTTVACKQRASRARALRARPRGGGTSPRFERLEDTVRLIVDFATGLPMTVP